MGLGFLKIELTAGEGALPVAGAKVLVKSSDGTDLYTLETDEAGDTQTVEIEAPDAVHTLDPEDPGPFFATVDVGVRVEDFYPALLKGVQIFDGETSILPINLYPTSSKTRDASIPRIIDIPPVFGIDEPKNQEGGGESAPISRTQREVFIPEYITVHLGRPNQDASNVKVKFIDYIKNVASSEIYPTWPEASLEANIYAIISLTLNRIYTVWYRSRGYNFDITSSTTVDQYFVYGRNIFESISKIVDRIFNIYIRRAGRREPFFAEYCNGSTVTCPGMSQWGTVGLAQKGLPPIDILKTYYPKDIELVETNQFGGNVETYPGYILREGVRSEAVRTMQIFLNRISGNFPNIPKVTPTGLFDAATTAAVKEFQKTFDLPPDGVVGKATWYKITSIYVAVKKLAELTSEGERFDIGLNPPTSVLRPGARGEDVVELQFLLNYISEFYPQVPSVIEDGIFSTQTQNAVKEFQKNFGLTADGIVGPSTWRKLYEVYHSIGDVVGPGPTPPPNEYPGTALRVGSRGESVRFIQGELNKVAQNYPQIPKITADGAFGPATEAAVIAFQRLFGLTPDGVIGPATWNKIVSEAARPTPPSNQYPGTPLRLGSRGESVRYMQEQLNKLAQYYPQIPRLTADGSFGPATEGAVIAFQRLFGLTPDGVVGPATWNRIVSEASKPRPESPAFPGTSLRVGARSEDVRLMQNYLNRIGQQYPQIPRLTADGAFGPATESAVIAFQRLFGLTPDGIIGRATWNRIVDEYNKLVGRTLMQAMLVNRLLGIF